MGRVCHSTFLFVKGPPRLPTFLLPLQLKISRVGWQRAQSSRGGKSRSSLDTMQRQGMVLHHPAFAHTEILCLNLLVPSWGPEVRIISRSRYLLHADQYNLVQRKALSNEAPANYRGFGVSRSTSNSGVGMTRGEDRTGGHGCTLYTGGFKRGIQRGMWAQYSLYSLPNVRRSAGSS
jgi:hypothetical protein